MPRFAQSALDVMRGGEGGTAIKEGKRGIGGWRGQASATRRQ